MWFGREVFNLDINKKGEKLYVWKIVFVLNEFLTMLSYGIS